MKMFKKIMAVALVGVMALSMLTGCAITDAMKEKAAEKGLEAVARSNFHRDVDLTQVDKAEYKNAMADVKADIQDKKYTVSEAKAVESATTEDYSVVVIAEPKSATTEAAWQKVGASIYYAYEDSYNYVRIYFENVNDSDKSLKAKVYIEAVEGVDANGKDQTYFVFVFAANDKAYNK